MTDWTVEKITKSGNIATVDLYSGADDEGRPTNHRIVDVDLTQPMFSNWNRDDDQLIELIKDATRDVLNREAQAEEAPPEPDPEVEVLVEGGGGEL